MGVKIKICGITNEEDATWAVNLGAHYLGFNFHSNSPRKVSPQLAARIVAKVPPFVPCIGVFVEQTVPEILKIVQKTGLMGVQLHGDQTPEDCRALMEQMEESVLLIKSFRVAQESDLEPMGAYQYACKYFLLDAKAEVPGGTAVTDSSTGAVMPLVTAGTPVPSPLGGTGKTFPWELAQRAKAFKLPLFVAGGLTPENVREAIKQTDPFGVDVASGVEKSPKRKDYDKLKSFIEQARKG